MNNNIIVELSNKNAQSIINNGDFETAFQPVLINDGDVIQIKNTFIDTIQQSYDQIFIPEDVNITYTVCYYEIDTQAPADANKVYSPGHQNVDSPNFGMYIQFTSTDQVNYELATSTGTAVLPKGLYSPDSLAVILNRQFVSLGSYQSKDFYGIQTPFVETADFDGSQDTHDLVMKRFFRMHIPNGSANCYFDLNDSFVYNINFDPAITRFWTGAREVAIAFNDDGDNRFQFKFLHTPCYDDQGNMVVYFGAYNPNYPVTREAGCMFIDLQPRDFWQSLGFDVESMLFKLSSLSMIPGISVPQVLSFNNETMTCENLLTIDDMFGRGFTNPGDGSHAKQIMWNIKQSTNTRGIYASQFYSFIPLCPFLMIEFLTNFNGTYLTGNDSSKFITAIVSRNYTTNNYVTGYSDSSITYQHKGEPFLLSSIRTRILNPDTKNVAKDVGTNNYVIIQILKNNSQ